jgi:hypothetical protein
MYGASTIHPVRSLAAYVLAIVIFLGTLVLWIGIPLASLWIVSKLTNDALYHWLIVLIVCPLSMLVFAGFLVRLNDIHLRVTGAPPLNSRSAWLKSLSGERARRPTRSVLEVSMLISVGIALVALFVWYFFFAHSSNPGLPAP